MSINDEIQSFYREKGFGEVIGERPRFVKVYTGCLLVPMPNIEARMTYLKFHDLHHLITGYSVGRIGEGEMSSWELGTGSMWRNPLIGIMNLVALSTGWFLNRGRMWKAFGIGVRSNNLYGPATRRAVDADQWASVAELSKDVLEVKPQARVHILRRVEYFSYLAISLLMHLFVAVPAVLMRYASDVGKGHGVFGSMHPKVRKDLY